MAQIPKPIVEFLAARRIAVAGASRDPSQPANAILRRLRETGHEVVPVNPRTTEVEGERCHHNLASVPGPVDAVMVVTHPRDSAAIVREAASRGIRKIWFHRSFGRGSVSPEAIEECRTRGIEPIVGGCPMMFAGQVDPAHRCFRWWFGLLGRVPR